MIQLDALIDVKSSILEGVSGYSGYSGVIGTSGFSGTSGTSGFSGTSGYSGDITWKSVYSYAPLSVDNAIPANEPQEESK